jgi:N-acetylglucosamine-6-phosphate deacetylase
VDDPRIVLTGADLLLPDRVAAGAALVIEHDRIADIVDAAGARIAGAQSARANGGYIGPGFVDVHVHGVNGIDVLDGDGSVARVAAHLPRWGVTAFCPTAVACGPETLRTLLAEVRRLRADPPTRSARVLPAHLESNFLNPEYRGAQPADFLCPAQGRATGGFDASEVLAVIDEFRPEVAIVTLAPELPGAIALIRWLRERGILVSLGHCGATYDQARAGLAAGASRATHLFNAMVPLGHGDPGVIGAVLVHDQVHVELICDGHHVHPAVMRIVIAAKGADRVVAITDGTAASGLPFGSRAHLGAQPVTARDVAYLDDGTRAGSVLTMDRAFQVLVRQCGCDLVAAAVMCATTPARDVNVHRHGSIAPGHFADLVELDRDLNVKGTWIGGRVVTGDR